VGFEEGKDAVTNLMAADETDRVVSSVMLFSSRTPEVVYYRGHRQISCPPSEKWFYVRYHVALQRSYLSDMTKNNI
jgi:hypothetical protein